MFNSNNILLQTTYDSPGLLLILPKNNEYFKKVFFPVLCTLQFCKLKTFLLQTFI